MSNELNNIISNATDGVVEGVAIGGDRYPGTTFMDHIMRYEADPACKLIVLLGEVGGTEEYDVCQAITEGRITKPLVAWCIGTCASMFKSEVQFGHAGSCANSDRETAKAKNASLKSSGAYVPESFDTLGDLIGQVYRDLVARGTIVPVEEVPPPTVPMDYSWARELGLIRKPASFMTSICDERGQELLYAGMPISDVLNKNVGIGGVISLLWFQKCLPPYVCKFFEMCLMVTADHGPAVSGAHNTIVCARAGKDLVSSLVSGLLTIVSVFGGKSFERERVLSQLIVQFLAGRPIRRSSGWCRASILRSSRHEPAPDGVCERDEEEGPADYGHRPPRQVDQQSGRAGEDHQRVCDGALPGQAAARVRARGGEDHDEQKAKSDSERGRCHRHVICGHAAELRIVHQVYGVVIYRGISSVGQWGRANWLADANALFYFGVGMLLMNIYRSGGFVMTIFVVA